MSSEVLSCPPSSLGGSQVCSFTFHSLICWSHERRLYFLNLFGVLGWIPGWRMCLQKNKEQTQRLHFTHLKKIVNNYNSLRCWIAAALHHFHESPHRRLSLCRSVWWCTCGGLWELTLALLWCSGHRLKCFFHSWSVSDGEAAPPHQSPCCPPLWSHSWNRQKISTRIHFVVSAHRSLYGGGALPLWGARGGASLPLCGVSSQYSSPVAEHTVSK